MQMSRCNLISWRFVSIFNSVGLHMLLCMNEPRLCNVKMVRLDHVHIVFFFSIKKSIHQFNFIAFDWIISLPLRFFLERQEKWKIINFIFYSFSTFQITQQQRHLSDNQVNNRRSKSLRNGKLKDDKWSAIQVKSHLKFTHLFQFMEFKTITARKMTPPPTIYQQWKMKKLKGILIKIPYGLLQCHDHNLEDLDRNGQWTM